MFNIYQPLPTTEAEIKDFLAKVESLIRSAPDKAAPQNRCALCGKPKPLQFVGVGYEQTGYQQLLNVELTILTSAFDAPGWTSFTRHAENHSGTTVEHCPDCSKKVYPRA